jgi:hypothetical protein
MVWSSELALLLCHFNLITAPSTMLSNDTNRNLKKTQYSCPTVLLCHCAVVTHNNAFTSDKGVKNGILAVSLSINIYQMIRPLENIS